MGPGLAPSAPTAPGSPHLRCSQMVKLLVLGWMYPENVEKGSIGQKYRDKSSFEIEK